MNGCDLIVRSSLRYCLIFGIAMMMHLSCHAQAKPLTESQLINVSNGPLKSNPEALRQLVEAHGLDFIPTKTSLVRLPDEENIRNAVFFKAGQQMRIRVCKFTSDDAAIADQFARSMRNRLIDRKGADIPPFGRIPLDYTIGPAEPCEKDTKENLILVLLQGEITGNGSSYSLILHVISLSPSGDRHPLLNGSGNRAPQAFTRETLDKTAEQVVDWGIKTVQEYAQQ